MMELPSPHANVATQLNEIELRKRKYFCNFHLYCTSCGVVMELSWAGLALILLLLASSEQPCFGNETNGREVQKEVIRDPNMAAPSPWSRYV